MSCIFSLNPIVNIDEEMVDTYRPITPYYYDMEYEDEIVYEKFGDLVWRMEEDESGVRLLISKENKVVIDKSPVISIVNITSTGHVTYDLFNLPSVSDSKFHLSDNFEMDSTINSYSRPFTIKVDNCLIKGRIFQNKKVMIYSKRANPLDLFSLFVEQIKTSYQTHYDIRSMKLDNISHNILIQFNLDFHVNYMKLVKNITQNTIIIGKELMIKVTKIKSIDLFTSGYLFYVSNDKYNQFSFTVFYTGKIQARGYGNENAYEELVKYCNNLYVYFLKIRDKVEEINQK